MDLLTGKNLVILGKLKLCFSEIKFKCGKLHRSRLLVNIISFCFPSNQVFASVGWSMPLMLDPSQMKLRCSQLLQNQSVPLVDNRTIVHIKRKTTSSSDCIFYCIYLIPLLDCTCLAPAHGHHWIWLKRLFLEYCYHGVFVQGNISNHCDQWHIQRGVSGGQILNIFRFLTYFISCYQFV